MNPCLLRFLPVIVVVLFKHNRLMVLSQAGFRVEVYHNKVLDQQSCSYTADITIENKAECLNYCLEDCRCMSFQICDMTKCQLCLFDKYQNESALRMEEGCNYFVFKRKLAQETGQQCGHSCSLSINCCLTSNPCENGGTCTQLEEPNSGKRYACMCPVGYAENNCEQPIRSCQGYNTGDHVSGYYSVLDKHNQPYKVYCHLNVSKKIAWTLIESYSLANASQEYDGRAEKKLVLPLYTSQKVAENTPNLVGYRLSKSRMELIQRFSSKWALTCNYDKLKNKFPSEFVLVSNNEMNILSSSGSFIKVGRLKLREIVFKNCQVKFVQNSTQGLHMRFFHGQGVHRGIPNCWHKQLCKTQNSNECDSCPNYFGMYYKNCLDPSHECSKNKFSTTQIWLGG